MRRVALSVGSTLVSGLSNLIVQLVASSLLAVGDFAEFSIVAATAIFGLGLGRAVIGQTDILRGSRSAHNGPADAALVVALAQFLVGGLLGVVAFWTASATTFLIALGVFICPFFVLQDAVRFRSFRIGRPSAALLSDALVLLVAVILLAVTSGAGHTEYSVTAIWCAATVVGLLAGAIMIGYRPYSPKLGWVWIVRHGDLLIPGSGEYLLQSAVPYALNFAILAVGGAPALAGYRLVQLLFAALGNFAAGLNAAMLPGLVDSRDPRLAQRNVLVEIFTLTAASVVLYALINLVPSAQGNALFGESWSAMLPFVGVGAIHGWVNALGVPNYSLLRLLGRARLSFWVRVGSVVAILLGVLGVSSLGDPVAIAWAIAIPAAAAYAIRLAVSQSMLIGLVRRNEPIRDAAEGDRKPRGGD